MTSAFCRCPAAPTPIVTVLPTRRLRWAAAASSLLVLGACASSPPAPTAQMAVSTAAVAQAVTAGGSDLAPGELRAAQDKLAQANTALVTKDNARALTLAQQAELDARLATARAGAAKAQRAAASVQAGTRALSEEIDRKKP